MPLIGVVGDIHGDIDGMYKWLLQWQERTGAKLDAILHVGDFGIYLPSFESKHLVSTDFPKYWLGRKEAPIPTWVCPGNHEEFAVLEWWLKQPDRMANLRLLNDGEITDVLGVKVGAIWGNYSFKSWNNSERVLTARRQHKLSPKAMHILQSSVRRLQRAGKFDVLITHDAPSRLMKTMKKMDTGIMNQLGLDPDEKAIGCPGFNELYVSGKPKAHFFGHFHTYYVCQGHDPLVVCLHCFNYNQEQAFWPLEFDINLEEARNHRVLFSY